MAASASDRRAIQFELGNFSLDQTVVSDDVIDHFWDTLETIKQGGIIQTAIAIAEAKAASAADLFQFSAEGQSFSPQQIRENWAAVAANLRHKLSMQSGSGMLITREGTRAARRAEAGL